MKRIKAALFKPLPRWAHRLLSVFGGSVALLWTLGFLIALAYLLFGSRGMSGRFVFGIATLWILVETILAWCWTIDTWKEGNASNV